MHLERSFTEGLLPKKYHHLLLQFYACYKEALEKDGVDSKSQEPFFLQFLKLVETQIKDPFIFEPYHRQIRSPFDHYQFGLNFLRPLIDLKRSSLTGKEHLEEICQKLQRKENVIFLANHQIEADPQVLSVMLENDYPKLAENMIFVAGERVLTDPLAAPFSMGYNLLCIYSKRYIDHPPELKTQKQLHNKKTMELMSDLLCEGGHAIYVAPSGGRDRANSEGLVPVSSFDPSSIELFYLMTQKALRPTSFYPMALYTYDLLPPPDEIKIELGEERKTQRGGVHVSIGKNISMEEIPGLAEVDKKTRREVRAEYIWDQVCKLYAKFPARIKH